MISCDEHDTRNNNKKILFCYRRNLFKIGKKLSDAHMSHHFHNENYNWGITNMIGDYFFGTLKDNKSIKKSTTAKSIAGYTD